MTTLTPVGKRIRIGATLLGLLLLIVTTLFGTDDDFPAAPFRMYSTTDKLDAPVRSLRLEGVTVEGERIVLRDSDTGLRRAEIEGQQARIKADPALLDAVAEAYHARNPSEPRLREVDVVVRLIQLRDGRPTGEQQDTTTVRREIP
ncbi:hypothetical protein [Cryptosporangium arvum]|uniref:hypothetical protein n=1 Tax=Cryptosporangium arvum TaxID=80871 RepID=UPI0004B264BE|nr:hypothetical protein [Cryptosporangium arvum]